MLENYRKHVENRAAQGIVPQPLNEQQTADLVELLKNPPAGEEATLVDLLENRIPPGVDQAAYVKAAFLAAIVKGETTSPLISKLKAIELLGHMQGGYNVEPLIQALDDKELAKAAGDALKKTLLVFDAFNVSLKKRKRAMKWPKRCYNLGQTPNGSPAAQKCQKKPLTKPSKSPVKPTLMICHLHKMHGHAQTSHFTH